MSELLNLARLASRGLFVRSNYGNSLVKLIGGRSRCMAVSTAASLPKVIVITGPTAVGKTALSLELAEKLGGEVISADSIQVYKGLDIGSDKLPESERRGIPHHLIDILPANAEFSSGEFHRLGRIAAEDILKRGKTPIVVGGTGLYLRWFIHGKPTTPPSDPAAVQRAKDTLEKAWAQAEQEKGAELTREEKWDVGVQTVAAAGDVAAADKVREERNNYYRLTRVLEVVQQGGGRARADMDVNTSAPLDYDFRCFFLDRPRLKIFKRINERCEQMVAGGLLQEAGWLLEQGLTPETACAARGIGYRHAINFLRKHQATPRRIAPEDVVQLVKDVQTASRQFATRQYTWFRTEPMFRWVDAFRKNEVVVQEIMQELEKPVHEGGCGTGGRLDKTEQEQMKRYKPKFTVLAEIPAQKRAVEAAREVISKLPVPELREEDIT